MSTTNNDFYTIDIDFDEIREAREQVFILSQAFYELGEIMTSLYEKFAPFCSEPGEEGYPFDDEEEYLSDEEVSFDGEDICKDCDTPCDLKADTKDSDGEALAIELLKAVFNCLSEICEKGDVD